MTEDKYEALITAIEQVRGRIQTVEIQLTLMSPIEILEFKAKALATLKAIDDDIDDLSSGMKECRDEQKEFLKEYHEEREDFIKDMSIVKTKIGTHSAGIALVVSAALSLLIAFLT